MAFCLEDHSLQLFYFQNVHDISSQWRAYCIIERTDVIANFIRSVY